MNRIARIAERLFLLFLFSLVIEWLSACVSLHAQTVTVTALGFSDSSGKLITGQLWWQPTLIDGTPASYRLGSGGQVTSLPVSVYVQKGVLSFTIADTSLTSPANICFRLSLTTTNSKSALGPGYSCVQPHSIATSTSDWCQSGICNLDDYTPNLPALPIVYVSPDLMNAWNVEVASYRDAGNTILQTTLTDAATVTDSTGGSLMSIALLTLNNSIPTRTINVMGLVSGARFGILINPSNSLTVQEAQTVIFGSGCTWQFAPGAVVSGNALHIPPWANWSYFAYFVYDGTNCIGMVAD
jgi:hypothetical protein